MQYAVSIDKVKVFSAAVPICLKHPWTEVLV